MKTYPTYQAAKIANPDQNIYRYLSTLPIFTCESECNGFSLQPANPADYCMTVKQFLDAGNKGVNGDLYLNKLGELQKIGVNCGEDWFNEPSPHDDKRYVIKAKALEETKTYRYGKVTDSIENIAKAMIDGETFYSKDGSDRFDWRLNGFGKNNLALTGLNGFDFYRRIEVTERELFIEEAMELSKQVDVGQDKKWLGIIYDELVDGKG
tara:strand:- start:9879 stop:10505 length:627 start_codon:yes stop_codon:yes gene_type:complete